MSDIQVLMADAEQDAANDARWEAVDAGARELLAAQDYTMAAFVFERAAELCPLPARKISLLKAATAVAKDHLGDVEAAIKYLREIVDLDPSDARSAGALDELLAATGRPPRR